jgi:serine protease
MRRLALIVVLGGVLTACLDPRFPPGITGTVYGPVQFTAVPGYEQAELRPDEAIVRFKTAGMARAQALSADVQVRAAITDDTVVLRRTDARGVARAQSVGDAKRQTLEWIAQLRARPDVVYAEPNTILRPFAVSPPNDPRYAQQWHYPMLNLPAAWNSFSAEADVGAGVTVAVVDSGILYDRNDPTKRHPDFTCDVAPGVPKIAPGYDFARNDDNPYDDALTTGGAALSGYHGSHVAGTVGACTNDNFGVAGVAWRSRILPVRVFNGDGGTLEDVARGIYWAAGVPLPSSFQTTVPANPNPAQVINLSLGAIQAPSQVLQDAINAANTQGAVVVVAAGNSGVDASTITPANLQGVIVVGAVGAAKELAPYSNDGPQVSLVAPGGNFTRRGSPLDGVLSVQACGAPNADLADGNPEGGSKFPCAVGQGAGSGYIQGTSMAAPHVAGVIALMMSRQAALRAPSGNLERERNWARVLAYLRDASSLANVTNCERGCGAGLLDAGNAVNRAVNFPAIGPLVTMPSPLGAIQLGANGSSARFTLKNSGDAVANVTFTTTLQIAPSSATLAPGEQKEFTVSVNRASVSGSVGALVSVVTGTRTFGFRVYYQNAQNTLDPSGKYYVRLYTSGDRKRLNYPDTPVGADGKFSFSGLKPGTSYDLTAYRAQSINPDGTVVADQLAERLGIPVETLERGQDIVLEPVLQTICSREGTVEQGPTKCPAQ